MSFYTLTSCFAPPKLNKPPIFPRPPSNTTWAIPPIGPPAKNAAAGLAIPAYCGATALIAIPAMVPAPIPIAALPIMPRLKIEPMPDFVRLNPDDIVRVLLRLLLRLAIVGLLVLRLLTLVDLRFLVGARLRALVPRLINAVEPPQVHQMLIGCL